ncbi:ATPase synthesis 25 mitochondrial protein [Rutstroemia sp. NJR-2017a BBW]|nr:ATPase synthesis 25 mitochondrial protein [Rutstroemia sp. NJR-2017a BBW]
MQVSLGVEMHVDIEPRTIQISSVSRKPKRFSSSLRENSQDGIPEQEYATTREAENDDAGMEEEGANKPNQQSEEGAVSSVPWYLQVETPQRIPQTLSERQKIPELPESPPPILAPMLQQISVDLGLDNLTLLDLRKLDPPPALGANLIMLIGTARSEKHLHVSADRLCRWLRSTYKLRPSADGLLGRNELKLKLRRKSRRAKLVGSTADEDLDDGIRTGWVCVDIGAVEGAKTDVESVISEGDGFVGFGRRSDGVRIVVQMLTEEKREEIDLEHLWGGILQRANSGEIEEFEDTEQADVSTSNASTSASRLSSEKHVSGTDFPARGFQIPQSRAFHTSRHINSKMQRFVRPVPSGSPSSSDRDRHMKSTNLTEFPQSIRNDFAIGNFQGAIDRVRRLRDLYPELDMDGGSLWRSILTNQIISYLTHAPVEEIITNLGDGYRDDSSTSFLKLLHLTLSTEEQKRDWKTRFWLYIRARQLNHPGYNAFGLMEIFNECVEAGTVLPEETYLSIIRSLLQLPKQDGVVVETLDRINPPAISMAQAYDVIRVMDQQGMNILTENMFVTLLEALEPVKELTHVNWAPIVTVNDSFGLPTKAMSGSQRRVHLLMISLELPPFTDRSRMRLMEMYARNSHWVAFWDLWRMPLRFNYPQSAAMYEFMFRKVAETGHEAACMKALRTWLENIFLEDPEVKLEGDLAEAVKACVLVADPYVQVEAADPNKNGEWITVWRQCEGNKVK